MTATKKVDYVEVYIWLAKDIEGYTTTSSEGGRLSDPHDPSNLARCGHASLMMYDANKKSQAYASLWPGKEAPAVLVPSLKDDEGPYCEKTRPDTIVRLYNLNVSKMMETFKHLQERVKKNKLVWTWDCSISKDVTLPSNNKASCVTFAYALLKMGGIQKFENLKGPSDKEFYNLTKCNAGTRFGGFFDGFWWTDEHFTPKALLLRVASAAEVLKKSKECTEIIMQSNRVAKEKDKETSLGSKAAVVVVALGILAFKVLKK